MRKVYHDRPSLKSPDIQKKVETEDHHLVEEERKNVKTKSVEETPSKTNCIFS